MSLFFRIFLLCFIGPQALAVTWMSETAIKPNPFSSTVEEAMTYRQIDSMNRDSESHVNQLQGANRLQQGKDRAKEIVTLIRDNEVKTRLLELQPVGERIKKDQSLNAPIKVVGVAAALWVGKNLNLVKNEKMILDARLEARARSGGISVSSKAVSVAVDMNAGSGMNVTLSRELPLLEALAEFYYGSVDHTLRAALSRPIIQNLIFSVGAENIANQGQGNAKIAYSVNL